MVSLHAPSSLTRAAETRQGKKLSFDRHQQFGDMLQDFYSQLLGMRGAVRYRYGTGSLSDRRIQETLQSVDFLKETMTLKVLEEKPVNIPI